MTNTILTKNTSEWFPLYFENLDFINKNILLPVLNPDNFHNNILSVIVNNNENIAEFRVEDYKTHGGFFCFSITKNNILHSEKDLEKTITWDTLHNKIKQTIKELKTHNVSEKFFIKHYVLTNSMISYVFNQETFNYIDFYPVIPNQQYYETLTQTPNIDIITTRLILDLIYTHNFTVEEALNIHNIPTLWLEALYSDSDGNTING
jgi:hypothetical protein